MKTQSEFTQFLLRFVVTLRLTRGSCRIYHVVIVRQLPSSKQQAIIPQINITPFVHQRYQPSVAKIKTSVLVYWGWIPWNTNWKNVEICSMKARRTNNERKRCCLVFSHKEITILQLSQAWIISGKTTTSNCSKESLRTAVFIVS